MIIITGATGNLGSAVVESLLLHLPASQVAVSVRQPEQAEALKSRGIDVRHGDFDRPETLLRAFDGADRLLLISASGIEHEARVIRHRHAIDAASRAGVGHIFYTSLLPSEGSVAYVMKAHLDTEQYLKDSGLPFTIFKNSAYAEAWRTYLGDISGEGEEVQVPADGPVSWVSRRDLAEGIARLLYEGGRAGDMLNMTGPEALDVQGIADILGRVLGHPLRRRLVPPIEYVAREVASGKTVENARQWSTTYFAMARYEFARVDPFLQTLLARPLRTAEEVLADNAPGMSVNR